VPWRGRVVGETAVEVGDGSDGVIVIVGGTAVTVAGTEVSLATGVAVGGGPGGVVVVATGVDVAGWP
jgi:hypothetical protein